MGAVNWNDDEHASAAAAAACRLRYCLSAFVSLSNLIPAKLSVPKQTQPPSAGVRSKRDVSVTELLLLLMPLMEFHQFLYVRAT